MPKYNRQCKNCGTMFEEQRTYEEYEHASRCPACKSRKVKTIIETATPVIYGDDDFTKKTKRK